MKKYDDKWIDEPLSNMSRVQVGKEFEYKELCNKYDFEQLSASKRRGYGMKFANVIRSDFRSEVEILQSGRGITNIYKRIK